MPVTDTKHVTIKCNLGDYGFQAKVALYLYGVVASLRGTDFVNGDVAGDCVDSEGVPAVDVHWSRSTASDTLLAGPWK